MNCYYIVYGQTKTPGLTIHLFSYITTINYQYINILIVIVIFTNGPSMRGSNVSSGNIILILNIWFS